MLVIECPVPIWITAILSVIVLSVINFNRGQGMEFRLESLFVVRILSVYCFVIQTDIVVCNYVGFFCMQLPDN